MAVFEHYSVLLKESIEALEIKENGIYVDCTLGGGGHSEALAKRLSDNGKIVAIDRDPEAIAAASQRLAPFKDRFLFVNRNYCELDSILEDAGIDKIDGVIMDLGVSSYQLDTPERGFSFHVDAPLDMRMCQNDPLNAKDVVNTYSAAELARIISLYGEEKNAGKIAAAIVRQRELKPFETTLELAQTVKSAFSTKERFEGKHPARRTFQAIRIEVNHELDVIEKTIDCAVKHLKTGGVISVISFHSLEDRIVKEAFRKYVSGCTCPADFPVCVCGFVPQLEPVNRKPIVPSEKENSENSRSRSAKLRSARKI